MDVIFTEKHLECGGLQNSIWHDDILLPGRAGAKDVKFYSGRELCFLSSL